MKKFLLGMLLLLCQPLLAQHYDAENPIKKISYRFNDSGQLVLEVEVREAPAQDTLRARPLSALSFQGAGGQLEWAQKGREAGFTARFQQRELEPFKFYALVQGGRGENTYPVLNPNKPGLSEEQKWKLLRDLEIAYVSNGKPGSTPLVTINPYTEQIEQLNLALDGVVFFNEKGEIHLKLALEKDFRLTSLELRSQDNLVARLTEPRMSQDGKLSVKLHRLNGIELNEGTPYKVVAKADLLYTKGMAELNTSMYFGKRPDLRIEKVYVPQGLYEGDLTNILIKSDVHPSRSFTIETNRKIEDYERVEVAAFPRYLSTSTERVGDKKLLVTVSNLNRLKDRADAFVELKVNGQDERITTVTVERNAMPVVDDLLLTITSDDQLQVECKMPSWIAANNIPLAITYTDQNVLYKMVEKSPGIYGMKEVIVPTVTAKMNEKGIIEDKFTILVDNKPIFNQRVRFISYKKLTKDLNELKAELEKKSKEQDTGKIRGLASGITEFTKAVGGTLAGMSGDINTLVGEDPKDKKVAAKATSGINVLLKTLGGILPFAIALL